MVVYEFGPFHYDSEQRLLFRGNEVVPLVPKAIDTLHVLLERRGCVVEKAELMKLVWPDTTVEEVGLPRNISLLRKALEEENGGKQYIETIPRRGYRFVAEAAGTGKTPSASEPPGRSHGWRWGLAAACIIAMGALVYWQFYVPSRYLVRRVGSANLAVVPFESMPAAPDGSAFARGLSDALVTDLSKLPGVQVLSPSTVRRHQRVGNSMGLMGRLLGLDMLVEGTVQGSGERIRITARLVDVHTGWLVWAESYDYPTAGEGQGQTEVARLIASQVGIRVANGGKSHNEGQ